MHCYAVSRVFWVVSRALLGGCSKVLSGLGVGLFYLSHTRLYREYITSSEMYSLHLTHPKWTHTRSSGQPCYSTRGAVGGSVPCSRTPQLWYWRRIFPPPTIPSRYPLGHDCPRLVLMHCYAVHWVFWVVARALLGELLKYSE